MKNTLLVAGLVTASLAVTLPAAAQSPTPDAGWYLSAEAGAQAVEHLGGLGGLQFGRHVSPRLDVFGEGLYLQDVVTRRRSGSTTQIATYLAQSQGKTASSTLEIPAGAVGGGVRYFLTNAQRLRPYVMGQAGMARVTLRPAFVLGGADVTTSLGQYGVTLGADLTGTSTKAVFGGGFGVVTDHGPWSLDIGIRILSIRLDEQPANVSSLAIGIGRRF